MSVSIVDEIKRQASGRWLSILGMKLERTDSNGQPCPKPECGGRDRFNLDREFETNGRVFCRHCLPKGSGDGVGSFAWLNGISNKEAIKRLAEQLGIEKQKAAPKTRETMTTKERIEFIRGKLTIVDEVCENKRMPKDAFLLFGGMPDVRKDDEEFGDLNVVRIPTYDEDGKICSSFDLWPDNAGKYTNKPAGLFFPGRTPKAGESWVLVEGCKDGAALIGLGFPNVCGINGCEMNKKFAKLFKGCLVIVVHDLDKAGLDGAKKTCSRLSGVASSVRLASLPGDMSSGDGVREVRDKLGADAVRAAIEDARAWNPEDNIDEKKQFSSKPKVILELDEGVVADEVVKHLGLLGWNTEWIPEQSQDSVRVFVRGGSLVHAIESEDELTRGVLVIRPLPESLVRERITQACQLMIERSSGDDVEMVPTRPVRWLVLAIMQRGYYGGAIRTLTGVVQSPTIRADGSIIQTAGYDEASGLIYRPNADFPELPDNPTREDAQRAIEELNHVTVDFPFKSQADRFGWLAMVLSMIGRPCVDGCVPMFTITANIRGAGKSLLADAASLIAYGRPASRKTFTRDDDEQRKLVTSIAIEGTPCVLFDNLDVPLGGANIDAALTAKSWNDRVLGSSRTTGELPLRTVWVSTGNHVAFGSDVARRVLPIQLESHLEEPENRSGFVHSDLLKFVRDNRPKLAIAALKILRAYYVAGCPSVPDGVWGSFEEWVRVIRGAIVWAGGSDPLPTRKAASDSDDSRNLLKMLIVGLTEADTEGKGITAKDIALILNNQKADAVPVAPTLYEAVVEICGSKIDARRVGKRIKSFTDRVWNNSKIISETAHGGVFRYKVVPGGYGGSGGSFYPNPIHMKKIGSLNSSDTDSPYRDRPENDPPQPPQPPRLPETPSPASRVSGAI